MNHRFPNARPPIPCFQSAGCAQPVGRQVIVATVRTDCLDARHMHEAERAVSIRRQHGAVWDAYADCERSPFGWERGL